MERDLFCDSLRAPVTSASEVWRQASSTVPSSSSNNYVQRESRLDGWDHVGQAGFIWDWGFGQRPDLGSNNLVVLEGEDMNYYQEEMRLQKVSEPRHQEGAISPLFQLR